MLTWSAVFFLALGVYGQRALGLAFVSTNRVPVRWQAVIGALPLAIIVAVVALQTFVADGSVAVDARAAGVAAAAVSAWQKLPIAVTVVAAAVVTAGVRALT